MQGIGHFIVNDKKIFVLARYAKYGRYFKIRKSGKDGIFFRDESIYLNECPDTLKILISGKVVFL